MSFDQWLSMFAAEIVRIMDIQANMLMGGITVSTMLVLVIFNNYGWRRAFVMSAFTTCGVGGWYWIGIKILGQSVHSGPAFTIVVYTFLLCVYTIIGYLMAGVVVMLKPHPVVKMRQVVVLALNTLAAGWDKIRSGIGNVLVLSGESLFKEGAVPKGLRKIAKSIPTEDHKNSKSSVSDDLKTAIIELQGMERT